MQLHTRVSNPTFDLIVCISHFNVKHTKLIIIIEPDKIVRLDVISLTKCCPIWSTYISHSRAMFHVEVVFTTMADNPGLMWTNSKLLYTLMETTRQILEYTYT